MALCLELCQVVDHLAAEECGAVFKGWLVDDDLCALCLNALHDALDGGLAEVVGVRLHGKAIHANHTATLLGAKLVVAVIVVPASFAEHCVGDVVFAGAVRFHDGRHHVLWHVLVVGEQLLGVFW